MPQMYYSYTGPATEGRTVSWLTLQEAQELQKQEDELKKQQEADSRLAPVVNREVSRYAKETGTAEQITPNPESVPPSFRTTETSPVSKTFAELEANNDDTTELESVLSQIPPPKESMDNIRNVGAPKRTASTMLGEDEEEVRTQPQGQLVGLLSDLPPEIAQPLLIEYHSGGMSPSKFLSEVKKAKQELLAIKRDEQKTKVQTEADLAKIGKQSEGQLENTRLASEYDLEGNRIQGQTARDVARINAGSREQIASDRRDNAYSQRTFAMKPAQIDALTGMDKMLIDLNNIYNSYDQKYVGPLRGRVGGAAEKLGWLKGDEKTFRSALAGFKNDLLKIRSGAAVTDNELKRISQELPDSVDSPKQFKAAFDRAVTQFRNAKNNYIMGLQKSGYDVQGWAGDVTDIESYRRENGEAPPSGPSGAAYGGGTPTASEASSAGGSQGRPAVGQVEDGYVYIGGDPADPNSWTKAR